MSECKFQWSYFLDPHRNEQIVIRTDDEEEFETLKKKFKAENKPVEDPTMAWPDLAPAQDGAGGAPVITKPAAGGMCPKCHIPKKLSAKGKWYCPNLCWTK